MQRLRLSTPDVFRPLWETPARYKGAWGGRGSGKSHDRATALVVDMLRGHRVVCLREVQNSIKDSVKQLIEDKIAELGVADVFEVTRDEIRGPDNALCIFRGLKDHTAASIKSLEGFSRAWIEEAQTITQSSLDLLLPTIREDGSEIWFTWNPRYKTDPVDVLLRQNRPDGAIVVKANHSDNPFFPVALRADMLRDQRDDPEKYEHVWLGGYQRISAGAYYAKELAQARADGRIGKVHPERGPLVTTAWDLGIDDCTAVWFAQQVGREVRLIDYWEASDHDATAVANVLRAKGYEYHEHLLPHDAGYREIGSGRSYEDHLRAAGIKGRTVVLPRTNDVLGDIEEVRGFIAKCAFDEGRCERGLDALGSYRREFNEKHQTFNPRPLHDWASHGADAFRALAIGLRPVVAKAPPRQRSSAWVA